MVDYKIVSYCGLCKKRIVIKKGEQKKYYCNDCQKKIDKNNRKEVK